MGESIAVSTTVLQESVNKKHLSYNSMHFSVRQPLFNNFYFSNRIVI